MDNDDFSGLQILILFPSGLQIPMNILGADNDAFSGLQILILFPSGLQIPMNILGAKDVLSAKTPRLFCRICNPAAFNIRIYNPIKSV